MAEVCEVCAGATEDDGYGEPVHSDTGLYGVYDQHGRLTHVAIR